MLNKKYLLVIIAFGIVITLGFATPYSAPTYDSINFTLCSDYIPPTYNSINFTLGLDEPCVVDTCTYTTGNWDVLCSDNCTITTISSLPNNNLTLSGTGTFTILANITADMVIKYKDCKVNNFAGDGKKLMVV